jgi:DMSO/TMAO reductase YedYZ molybdopterin-dependent catalytic subunit
MVDSQNIQRKLPVHPGASGSTPHVLRVIGLVDHCLELTPADLAGFPQQELTSAFTCLEGWTVPGLKWRGVSLETLLNLAEIRSEAAWVQASAGDFSVPLSLHDARRALLAIHLGGESLPVEHGGPIRLLLPGGDCFTSIKWLDRLELRAEPAANTGRAIALGRLQTRRT